MEDFSWGTPGFLPSLSGPRLDSRPHTSGTTPRLVHPRAPTQLLPDVPECQDLPVQHSEGVGTYPLSQSHPERLEGRLRGEPTGRRVSGLNVTSTWWSADEAGKSLYVVKRWQKRS